MILTWKIMTCSKCSGVPDPIYSDRMEQCLFFEPDKTKSLADITFYAVAPNNGFQHACITKKQLAMTFNLHTMTPNAQTIQRGFHFVTEGRSFRECKYMDPVQMMIILFANCKLPSKFLSSSGMNTQENLIRRPPFLYLDHVHQVCTSTALEGKGGAGYHKNKGVHKERNNIHPDIRSAPTINDLKMS